jgi:hypothetical protein
MLYTLNMNENNAISSTSCLVCSYDLGKSISSAFAQDVICPSCGIQYGYSDRAGGDIEKRKEIYKLWREAWIENDKNTLSTEKKNIVISKALKL